MPTVNPDKQDFGDDDPLYSGYWTIVGLEMTNGKNYSLGTFPTNGRNIMGVESKDPQIWQLSPIAMTIDNVDFYW